MTDPQYIIEKLQALQSFKPDCLCRKPDFCKNCWELSNFNRVQNGISQLIDELTEDEKEIFDFPQRSKKKTRPAKRVQPAT